MRDVSNLFGACACSGCAPPGFVYSDAGEKDRQLCSSGGVGDTEGTRTEDEDGRARGSLHRREISALEPLARATLRSRDRKLEALLDMLEQAFEELKTDRGHDFLHVQGHSQIPRREARGEGILAGADVRSYSREGRGLPARREEQGAGRSRVQGGANSRFYLPAKSLEKD